MLICINGKRLSGKSTIVKKIIEVDRKSFLYKRYKSVNFMISNKFKILVIGFYPIEGVDVGADRIPYSAIGDMIEFICSFLRKNKEFSIIIESNRFATNDFYNKVISKHINFECFYLMCADQDVFLRNIKRLEPISSEKIKESNKNLSEISGNILFLPLRGYEEQDIDKNVKIILSKCGYRVKTKVR